MTSPLRWRVGDATVTQIVESSGTAPPTFLFANLSAEQVRSMPGCGRTSRPTKGA